jgi:hypothetical protein
MRPSRKSNSPSNLASTAGVDQVIFLQQADRNKQHIIGSLKPSASEVMPCMKQDAEEVTDKPTYRIGTTGGFDGPMEDLAKKTLGRPGRSASG